METLSITLFSATPVAAHIARGWNSPGLHRKKYCSFINLFVLYVSAVERTGLMGTKLVRGTREQSWCVMDGTWWTGVLCWDCSEDAQMTPNPMCHEWVIAHVTYAPFVGFMCVPTPRIRAAPCIVDALLHVHTHTQDLTASWHGSVCSWSSNGRGKWS